MTVEPLRPALSRQDALFTDPMLGGELLLMALAIDRLITIDRTSIKFKDVVKMTGVPSRSCRKLFLDDVPSYRSPTRPEQCQYVGPRGGVCQRSERGSHALRNVEDGTVSWVASCSLVTHRAWAEHQVTIHEQSLGVRTPPKPAYNTRSKIAHHFDGDIDFPAWWLTLTTAKRYGMPPPTHLVYDISRDPERGGSPLIQRPRLRLVLDSV